MKKKIVESMAAVMLFLQQTTGKTKRHTHFCMPLEPVFTRDCGGRVHFMDEPINGLDPIGIAEIRKFLRDLSKERGKTILISSHILSEIDLLADDIGIIHEGNLLEESSMDELRKKNQKYVLFRVSSTVTAARILEQKCGGVNYLIEDDNVMRVYDTDIDLSRINQEFITNNIGVYESRVCDESLEDYFKEITGGVGIA